MFITEILAQKKYTVSFESFPPKKETDFESIQKAVLNLADLAPDFMSVTYGAGGGTSDHTVTIAEMLQSKKNIPTVAHLTCVSSTKEEIKDYLDILSQKGIQNILALRGDIPADGNFPTPKHYTYAYELINDIRENGGFSIGGACYPEGHIECGDLQKDMEHLKIKMECGCQYFITQLFFDNNILYNFLDLMQKKQLNIPVIAGIMPVTGAKQISRMCSLSGAALPGPLRKIIEKYESSDVDMTKAGIDYAIRQILSLYDNGVNNIHIYTMNKVETGKTIMENIR